ncbi:hypothetical protein CRM22_007777 [Opisthorchis felineus]|uniref:Uncharacterized protein n=1 Tax=Opisthorchis felineus TaxID=147828 RepID=A0A4S2LE84_OPIFE|nr:hypothetical protein CRM22_007777 [Opisthorchis felineus]
MWYSLTFLAFLLSLCFRADSARWFPPRPSQPPHRHPPPPDLISHGMSPYPLPKGRIRFHGGFSSYETGDWNKRLRLPHRRRPLFRFSPKANEYELIDDMLGSVPIVIKKTAATTELTKAISLKDLDNTPVDVELVHLLSRLFRSSGHPKKGRESGLGGAHHIIITQSPAETTTSVQSTGNTCVPPNAGTGGAPRSETPQPVLPSLPSVPPTSVQPQQPALPETQQPVLPQSPITSTPRSTIPGGIPTSFVANAPSTTSQTAMSLATGLMNYEQPLMAVQQPVTLAPLLAELSALLLAAQPTLATTKGYATFDHGHGALFSSQPLASATLAQPQVTLATATPTMLGMPVSTNYGAILPSVGQMSAQASTADTHSSITSELLNLLSTLQQQHELQKQQLQQQQQLQQEQQNLLQQQRNQLAQQLQQATQAPATQPVVQPIQPIDQQGRSVFPTGDGSTAGTGANGGTNGQLLQPAQTAQTAQPAQTDIKTVISMLPRTILTISPEDHDEPGDDGTFLAYPAHGIRTIRTRKYFTRKLLGKPHDALPY